MNAEWHKNHALPKSASLQERISWHREHQKRCACRPIPPKLLDQMRRDPAIDEYLAGVTPSSRALLQKLRKTIHSIVPDVEECISYRIARVPLPRERHRRLLGDLERVLVLPLQRNDAEDARARYRGLQQDQERSSLRFRQAIAGVARSEASQGADGGEQHVELRRTPRRVLGTAPRKKVTGLDRALPSLDLGVGRLVRAMASLAIAIATLAASIAPLADAITMLAYNVAWLADAVAARAKSVARLARSIAWLALAVAWLALAVASLALAVAWLALAVASLALAVASLAIAVASLALAVASLALAIASFAIAIASFALAVASLAIAVVAIAIAVASLALAVVAIAIAVASLALAVVAIAIAIASLAIAVVALALAVASLAIAVVAIVIAVASLAIAVVAIAIAVASLALAVVAIAIAVASLALSIERLTLAIPTLAIWLAPLARVAIGLVRRRARLACRGASLGPLAPRQASPKRRPRAGASGRLTSRRTVRTSSPTQCDDEHRRRERSTEVEIVERRIRTSPSPAEFSECNARAAHNLSASPVQ